MASDYLESWQVVTIIDYTIRTVHNFTKGGAEVDVVAKIPC